MGIVMKNLIAAAALLLSTATAGCAQPNDGLGGFTPEEMAEIEDEDTTDPERSDELDDDDDDDGVGTGGGGGEEGPGPCSVADGESCTYVELCNMADGEFRACPLSTVAGVPCAHTVATWAGSDPRPVLFCDLPASAGGDQVCILNPSVFPEPPYTTEAPLWLCSYAECDGMDTAVIDDNACEPV